jgi:hypothetical protein
MKRLLNFFFCFISDVADHESEDSNRGKLSTLVLRASCLYVAWQYPVDSVLPDCYM